MKKLIIFDLDGVLIDSINNMKYAWEKSCKQSKLNIDFNKYKKFIGLPFEEILKKLKIPKIKHEVIKKNYNFFSKKKINKLKINRQKINYLKKLKAKGYTLAIFTSKNLGRTKIVLGKQKKLFKFILCPRKNIKGKPFPDGINYIIKLLRFKKKQTIYIGDTLYDYYCAKSAKVDYLHSFWGYQKTNLKNIKIIKNLNNLKKYLN